MLSALSALPGALGLICRGLARRVAPVAVRKVVAFLLGTTLTAALVPGTALAGIGHGTANGTVVATAQKARVSTAGGGAVAAPDASFRLVSSHPPATTVSPRMRSLPHPAYPPCWPWVPRRAYQPCMPQVPRPAYQPSRHQVPRACRPSRPRVPCRLPGRARTRHHRLPGYRSEQHR